MQAPAAPLVVLIAAQQDEYGSRIWEGARAMLASAGAPLLVHLQARPDVCLPQSLRQILRFGALRGVILTTLVNADADVEVAAEVGLAGVPAVSVAHDAFPGVRVRADNEAGMTALMRHLVEDCQVRRPVLVRGKKGQIDASEREEIFRRELGRRGIPVDEELVIDGNFWHDTAYHAMRRLLAQRRDMDAVVAMNDLSAFGALRALRESGLRVPQDVRLTGFDNLHLSQATFPGMTTVDQEVVEQGRVAASRLLGLRSEDRTQETIVVPSRLVVRGSTRPATAPLDELVERALSSEVQLAELGAISSLSRSLANARSLDDMLSAMTECLGWLGVDRFFLALHEPDQAVDATEEPVRARLVFDYRHGRVTPPPDDTFPMHQVLPSVLLSELGRGLLAVQPLETAEREVGYMVFDRTLGSITTSEIFQVNISRTLDALLSAQRLAVHAAGLEAQVMRRTRELEAEVLTRRTTELQLQRANAELKRLAMVDGLTGIANRTAFEEHVARHWDLAVRTGTGLCVALVDVDHFKAFNDHYGHLGGDEALRVVASCLQRAVTGPDDLACRYGGEEFVAVLPGGDLAAGTAVTDRFRRLLAREAIPHAASSVAPVVTVSIGVATRAAAGGTPTGLMAAADEALYRAKTSGRDRVCVTDHPQPEQSPRRAASANGSPPEDPVIPAPRRSSGARVE